MKPDAKRTAALGFRRVSNLIRTVLSQAGVDRRYAKVFAIGFNKTATTSIHQVFITSGLCATHSTRWGGKRPTLAQFAYQAFSDGNDGHFADLDRRFPRSKFILNIRDLDEWLDSRIEHIRDAMARGRHRGGDLWQIEEQAVMHWIVNRNQYHLAVLDYFKDRPGDFLLLNFIRDPDAAVKISNFCGKRRVAIKPYSRPIKKTRDAGQLRNEALIRTCLSRLGIPQPEWQTDIYCPSLETEAVRRRWAADSGAAPQA